jgi:hypothetical protein
MAKYLRKQLKGRIYFGLRFHFMVASWAHHCGLREGRTLWQGSMYATTMLTTETRKQKGKERKRPGTRYTLPEHASNDQLPLTSAYLLKFPTSSNNAIEDSQLTSYSMVKG